MKTQDAINHFGGLRKVAELLGLSTQAAYSWGDIVPKGRAYELQALTEGALPVVLSDYPATPATGDSRPSEDAA